MAELIMGFDFGTSRIGVAVGQKITASANPIAQVAARDGKPDWDALDQLIEEWQPAMFIVGLPLNMDDSVSEMATAAERFARRLEGRYQIPYEMMDERLSTFEAREHEVNDVDSMAAALILQSWLNR